jgi:hypothetical protein
MLPLLYLGIIFFFTDETLSYALYNNHDVNFKHDDVKANQEYCKIVKNYKEVETVYLHLKKTKNDRFIVFSLQHFSPISSQNLSNQYKLVPHKDVV